VRTVVRARNVKVVAAVVVVAVGSLQLQTRRRSFSRAVSTISQRSMKRSQVSLRRLNGKRLRSVRQNAPHARPPLRTMRAMKRIRTTLKARQASMALIAAVSKVKAEVDVVVAVDVVVVVDETEDQIEMVLAMHSMLKMARRARLRHRRSLLLRLPRHANQATQFACMPSRRKSN
jgi:hypothetical protein